MSVVGPEGDVVIARAEISAQTCGMSGPSRGLHCLATADALPAAASSSPAPARGTGIATGSPATSGELAAPATAAFVMADSP